jgi:translation initiation factor 3 subunit I
MVVYSTDQAMGKPCEIFFADVRDPSQLGEAVTRTTVQDSKVTSILWGPLDETVVTGHDNGKLTLWDLKVSLVAINK